MSAWTLSAAIWVALLQAPSLDETVAAYGEAWNETDEVKRAALLELSFAEDGIYEDPQSRYEGRQALFEGIGDFQRDNPGSRIELASGVDEHHGKIRFRWHIVTGDGRVVSEGMDYGELAEDGRIQRIVGFFGPFPEVQ